MADKNEKERNNKGKIKDKREIKYTNKNSLIGEQLKYIN